MFGTIDTAKKIRMVGIKKNIPQAELFDEMGISYPAADNRKRISSLSDMGKMPELALFFYSTPLVNDSYIFK